jgi:hypothetical protein
MRFKGETRVFFSGNTFADTILKNQYRGPYCPNADIPGWKWIPYQILLLNTPPFPEYPSGHSTFMSASMGVMARYLGTDNLPAVFRQPYKAGNLGYKFGTENHCFKNGTTFDGSACIYTECSVDPTYTSENNYSPIADGDIGPFTRFSQIAIQCGYSRIYGGIHIEFGNFGGLARGSRIANILYTEVCSSYVGWKNCLQGIQNFANNLAPSIILMAVSIVICGW